MAGESSMRSVCLITETMPPDKMNDQYVDETLIQRIFCYRQKYLVSRLMTLWFLFFTQVEQESIKSGESAGIIDCIVFLRFYQYSKVHKKYGWFF